MTTDMQRLNTLVHDQLLAEEEVAAARNEGRVRLLQWSGKNKKYIPITVKNLLTSTPNRVE